MLYFLLTGFHFLHVVVGMLAIVYLWWRTRQGAYGAHDSHALETGPRSGTWSTCCGSCCSRLVYVLR